MASPEERACQEIDRLLTAAGWAVQDLKVADLHAARGIARREFELNPGHGTADYLLYVDGRAAGIIEAKKQGATLTGVEVQSGRYAQGLPATLPAWRHLRPDAGARRPCNPARAPSSGAEGALASVPDWAQNPRRPAACRPVRTRVTAAFSQPEIQLRGERSECVPN